MSRTSITVAAYFEVPRADEDGEDGSVFDKRTNEVEKAAVKKQPNLIGLANNDGIERCIALHRDRSECPNS